MLQDLVRETKADPDIRHSVFLLLLCHCLRTDDTSRARELMRFRPASTTRSLVAAADTVRKGRTGARAARAPALVSRAGWAGHAAGLNARLPCASRLAGPRPPFICACDRASTAPHHGGGVTRNGPVRSA